MQKEKSVLLITLRNIGYADSRASLLSLRPSNRTQIVKENEG